MNAPASQKASFKVNGKIENTISRDLVHQPSDKKKHLPSSSLKSERVEEIQASVPRVLQSLGQGDPLVNGAEEQREKGPRGVFREERLHL